MTFKEAVKQTAEGLELDPKLVEKTCKTYFKMIREIITSQDLFCTDFKENKKKIDNEELVKQFILPNIGKIKTNSALITRHSKLIKKRKERYDKIKGYNTDVQ